MVFQWLDNLWQRTREFQSFTESGWKFLKFNREFSVAHEVWITICTQPLPKEEIKVLALFCVSGGSCSTYYAELDFTETTITVRPMFQATTWHTARDKNDHDGTAHTSFIGASTLTEIWLENSWFLTRSLQLRKD